MSSRRARGDAAAPSIERHPAATAAGLATAVAIGFGTTVLLIVLKERDMRRIARRIVPPRPSIALRNQFAKPRRVPSRRLVVAGGLAATAGIAGAFIILDSIFGGGKTDRFDRHLHNFFRMHRSAAQRDAVKSTTVVGDPAFVIPLDLIAIAGLMRYDKVREAVALAWTIIAMSAVSEALKNIVRRKRPSEGEADKDTYSFPSGHTMLASSSYLLIVCFLIDDRRLGAWRFAPAAALAALIPWTAFSRMYLGQHWPSDTIAGMALGLAWDAAIVTVLKIT
jgi:membrane-associated phospholipid phosphatase